jgi:ABC-2 type transport system permease protein
MCEAIKGLGSGLIFYIVVVPITFLGCVYYPWEYLNHLPGAAAGGADQPYLIHERGFTGRAHTRYHHIPALLIVLALLVSWPFWAG